jgi:hypothetical protein
MNLLCVAGDAVCGVQQRAARLGQGRGGRRQERERRGEAVAGQGSLHDSLLQLALDLQRFEPVERLEQQNGLLLPI